MKISFILMGILLVLGVIERILHRKNMKKIPIRILVNGTRGKTSTTRMIAAALNEAGIRTWAKSTGTAAVIIDSEGNETPTKRRRGANIREMIPFFRRAAKDHAQAVVVECMAVRPDLQRALADQLVRPTITLILNNRVDHVDVMGNTEYETAQALANSIRKDALCIAPEIFSEYTKNLQVPADTVTEAEMQGFNFPVFAENMNAALTALEALGVERETALRGMRKAKPDIGMAGPFVLGQAQVINGFAANDAESAEVLIREADAEMPILVVYNNRNDRKYRMRTFLPVIRGLGERLEAVHVIGETPRDICRYLRRAGINAQPSKLDDAFYSLIGEKKRIVLCLGNIKGAGLDMIERLNG